MLEIYFILTKWVWKKSLKWIKKKNLEKSYFWSSLVLLKSCWEVIWTVTSHSEKKKIFITGLSLFDFNAKDLGVYDMRFLKDSKNNNKDPKVHEPSTNFWADFL